MIKPPLTRRERAESVRKKDIFTKYGEQARAVLDALLQKYQDEGAIDLDNLKWLEVAPLREMGMPVQIIKQFGGKDGYVQAVHEIQSALYGKAA